jgi:hypothetical protein
MAERSAPPIGAWRCTHVRSLGLIRHRLRRRRPAQRRRSGVPRYRSAARPVTAVGPSWVINCLGRAQCWQRRMRNNGILSEVSSLPDRSCDDRREAFLMPANPKEPPPEVHLHLAGTNDLAVLERLWLMFRHDLSEFGSTIEQRLPGSDGRFRQERLTMAMTDPDWMAYLIRWADRPVGFALVRGVTGQVRVLNSFFVARGARRGQGRAASRRRPDRPVPRALGGRLPGRQPCRRPLLAPGCRRRHRVRLERGAPPSPGPS